MNEKTEVVSTINRVLNEGLESVMSPIRRALKPDAQAFDEIRIVTVPRYKQSYLSGNEWRISASIRFYRKGRLIHETFCSSIETATTLLGGHYLEAIDHGHGYFGGEENFCDQEGCSEQATVTYRMKKEYSRDNPTEWNREYGKDEIMIRKFCDKHKVRGDSSFNDCDENYEKIDLKGKKDI